MNEKINAAVAELFAGYPDTPELRDFQLEITANLEERVEDAVSGGLDREEALAQALAELGDITEVADTMSRRQRNKVIGEMMMQKVALDKTHSIGYPVAAGVLLFGILCGAMAGFNSGLSNAVGAVMPFAVGAGCAGVYLALTQETASHYPMQKKRAAWYTVGAGMLLFGVLVALLTFIRPLDDAGFSLGNREGAVAAMAAADKHAALGVLLVFVLPAGVLLGILVLTQRDRTKPWVQEMAKNYDEKSGMLSGALWLLAVALFFTLGMLVSFKYSWLVFLFALPAELIIQYFRLKGEE